VQQHRDVATVVKEYVRRASAKSKTFSASSQYFGERLALPAKTGVPCGLSTVPVAAHERPRAAAWFWVEKMLQVAQRTSRRGPEGLDQHRGLDRHVREPPMRAPASGLSLP